MKRAIVIVIDSMGIGAMPDCIEYGDTFDCNTLSNVSKAVNGLNAPNFYKLGLGNLTDVQGVKPNKNAIAQYGVMKEKSRGKDTTTGHWEMMDLILEKPFKVYPKGFPDVVIKKFIEQTNCKGILGNYPASGTKIIEDYYLEQARTKFPIIYTSADSVFQIAADINVIPLETLYKWCKTARSILTDEYNVSRVIARPYEVIDGKPVRIGAKRRDFSVEPFKDSTLDIILKNNGSVLAIGKIEDIFVGKGISHSIHTSGNTNGLETTLKAIKNELNLEELITPSANSELFFSPPPCPPPSRGRGWEGGSPTLDFCRNKNNLQNFDKQLIFTNLVDTDMLYGHRNDYKGYAKAIEEIDSYLPDIIDSMTEDDILMITADHGCDPTVRGTDHTREQVPLLIYSKNIKSGRLPEINCFNYISKRILDWFKI